MPIVAPNRERALHGDKASKVDRLGSVFPRRLGSRPLAFPEPIVLVPPLGKRTVWNRSQIGTLAAAGGTSQVAGKNR
jgi:hypothetical protein